MNRTTIIIIVLVALMVIFVAFKMAKKPSSQPFIEINEEDAEAPDYVPNENQLQEAFNEIKNIYGVKIAKEIEKIYRLETAHFKSGQYTKTLSPGMLAFSNNYPYKWSSTKALWDNDENMRPIGIVTMKIGNKEYKYLKFPTFIAAAKSVAEHLKKYGRAGRWYSTDPLKMTEYENKLKGIKTHFT